MPNDLPDWTVAAVPPQTVLFRQTHRTGTTVVIDTLPIPTWVRTLVVVAHSGDSAPAPAGTCTVVGNTSGVTYTTGRQRMGGTDQTFVWIVPVLSAVDVSVKITLGTLGAAPVQDAPVIVAGDPQADTVVRFAPDTRLGQLGGGRRVASQVLTTTSAVTLVAPPSARKVNRVWAAGAYFIAGGQTVAFSVATPTITFAGFGPVSSGGATAPVVMAGLLTPGAVYARASTSSAVRATVFYDVVTDPAWEQ